GSCGGRCLSLADYVTVRGPANGAPAAGGCQSWLRSGGSHVDDQLELRGLLDGEVSRLRAFQDFVDVRGGAPVQIREVHTVRQEAPTFHALSVPVDHGQAACDRQPYESSTVRREKSNI